MTLLEGLPVPPQLEAAVGYSGDARWFTLAWSPCGDTVIYDDGRGYGTGHGWGYLGFARSPAVAPHLRGLDLGSSEQDGTQRLVIDRVERRAYYAAAEDARRAVRDQWPAEPAVELTPEQWEAVVDEVRQRMLSRTLPTATELLRLMKEHAQLVAEMLRHLDGLVGRGNE